MTFTASLWLSTPRAITVQSRPVISCPDPPARQVEFLRHTLRFDVMEANFFCASLVRQFGYDVLDLHYHFRCLIHQ